MGSGGVRNFSIPFLWKGKGLVFLPKARSQPPPLWGTSFQRKEGDGMCLTTPNPEPDNLSQEMHPIVPITIYPH